MQRKHQFIYRKSASGDQFISQFLGDVLKVHNI
jgi:hypothetical protein